MRANLLQRSSSERVAVHERFTSAHACSERGSKHGQASGPKSVYSRHDARGSGRVAMVSPGCYENAHVRVRVSHGRGILIWTSHSHDMPCYHSHFHSPQASTSVHSHAHKPFSSGALWLFPVSRGAPFRTLFFAEIFAALWNLFGTFFVVSISLERA